MNMSVTAIMMIGHERDSIGSQIETSLTEAIAWDLLQKSLLHQMDMMVLDNLYGTQRVPRRAINGQVTAPRRGPSLSLDNLPRPTDTACHSLGRLTSIGVSVKTACNGCPVSIRVHPCHLVIGMSRDSSSE